MKRLMLAKVGLCSSLLAGVALMTSASGLVKTTTDSNQRSGRVGNACRYIPRRTLDLKRLLACGSGRYCELFTRHVLGPTSIRPVQCFNSVTKMPNAHTTIKSHS